MLDVELARYKKNKAALLTTHRGEYVLIIGDEQLGTFPTREAAYEFGVRDRGNVPMLIRQIVPGDEESETIPVLSWGLLDARF